MASDKNNVNKETRRVLGGCRSILREVKKGKEGEVGGWIKCQSCASGSTVSSESGSKLSTAAGLPVSWYNRHCWWEENGRVGATEGGVRCDVGGLTCDSRSSCSSWFCWRYCQSGTVNAFEVIILVMSVLLFYWFLIATARHFKANLRLCLSVLHPSTYIYIFIKQLLRDWQQIRHIK